MLRFPYRFIFLVFAMLGLCNCEKVQPQAKKDFVENLFQDVDAREQNPEKLPPRKYDDIVKKAISFKILNKYPKLSVGKIAFLPETPEDLKANEEEIKKGQDLILNDVLTPDMQNKSFTFKGLIDQINTQYKALQNLQYSDWVLIASAFRTLSAPDSQKKPNALGIFIAEYIIIKLIDEAERKSKRTDEENQILSSLYYILSQIYQIIANNPGDYNFVQNQKTGKSSPMYLSLPNTYYVGAYNPDQYIEPYTQDMASDYGVDYSNPYDYSLFTDLGETYDDLIGQRLGLLSYAVGLTPDYDLAWTPLIEFVADDIDSPFYINRLSPGFWDNYFPGGVVGISPVYIGRLHDRWNNIVAHDPRVLRNVSDPTRISNSLREIRSPEWRANRERRAALDIQGRQRSLAPAERGVARVPQQVIRPSAERRSVVRPVRPLYEQHFERPHPEAMRDTPRVSTPVPHQAAPHVSAPAHSSAPSHGGGHAPAGRGHDHHR